MAYASASRMNDDAAALGSSTAAGGRGLRKSRASPTTPATTTSSKTTTNMARSKYRISRMTLRGRVCPVETHGGAVILRDDGLHRGQERPAQPRKPRQPTESLVWGGHARDLVSRRLH